MNDVNELFIILRLKLIQKIGIESFVNRSIDFVPKINTNQLCFSSILCKTSTSERIALSSIGIIISGWCNGIPIHIFLSIICYVFFMFCFVFCFSSKSLQLYIRVIISHILTVDDEIIRYRVRFDFFSIVWIDFQCQTPIHNEHGKCLLSFYPRLPSCWVFLFQLLFVNTSVPGWCKIWDFHIPTKWNWNLLKKKNRKKNYQKKN